MSARRRGRVRWNRIIGAFIVCLFLIFLFCYGVSSCTDKKGNEESSKLNPISNLAEATTPTSSAAASETTSEAASTSASEPDAASTDVTTTTTQRQTYVIGGESTTTASTANTVDAGITNLLGDFTESIQPAADIYGGSLVLVDANNQSHLSSDELDLVLVARTEGYTKTYGVSYPGTVKIAKIAFENFNKMMTAYETAVGNREIMFNYGYLGKGDAKGNPESSSGLDIQLHLKKASGSYTYISNTGDYKWLYENAHKYGFVLRYPADKGDVTGVKKSKENAFRYVGVPHSAYMYENGLCLEEYLNLLKDKYTFGKGMLEYTFKEEKYTIYYYPASTTEDTKVPVPKSGNFTISGNNVDGFIVTVLS